MGSKKYLVSPQDLCGLEEVPGLIESGVDCFKIEGRLKTPEYVAPSARAYRQALDKAESSANSVGAANATSEANVIDAAPTHTSSTPSLSASKKDMAVSYSRGFFSGWLHGVNHQRLVNAEFSAHRGHEIGTVIDVFRNTMTIQAKDPIAYESLLAGDGLLWAKGAVEQGGFIYGIDRLPKSRLRVEFARDMVLFRDLEGAVVYQNHDKELKKIIAQSVEDKNKKKRIPVRISLKMIEGQPLQAQVSDGESTVEMATTIPVVAAQNRGVTDEQLTEEFSSLTGSLFRLQQIDITRASEAPLFIPHKEYKSLRQKLVAELTDKRQSSISAPGLLSPHGLRGAELDQWIKSQGRLSAEAGASASPRLNVLLREKGQVADLVEAIKSQQLDGSQIDTVTLDFEFGRDYQASVEALRGVGLKVGLATTRILKPTEYRNLKVLAQLQPDSILIRNLGALHYYNTEYAEQFELRGDFSLNVTNHLTADYLLNKGLKTLCLSYDLNHNQVNSLLENASADKMEITVYQYMPSFHMEHCVFAAFLSEGSSYRDCGKPCEKHTVRLKDQFQNWHHIKADQECRNTMYNARAQSASRYLPDWSERGLGFVRYEALQERSEELVAKVKAHLDLLNKQITYEDLVDRIGAIESYGISEGPVGREREYQSRKKQI
jgi:putative protease